MECVLLAPKSSENRYVSAGALALVAGRMPGW